MTADLEYVEDVQKAEVKFRSEKRNIKDEHAQFSGSIPAAYDRYLGPMLFQPYAEDLAARSLRH